MSGSGRPLGKGTIGTAIHTHTPIAPGLLGNPVDDRTRILTIVLERYDLTSTTALTTSERDNSYIPVSSTFARKGARINIDGELQQRRQGLGFIPGAHDHRRYVGPIARFDQHIPI